MTILGVDPGFAIVGYGVIEKTKTGDKFIECGVITTKKEDSLPLRLNQIDMNLETLIRRIKPDAIAVEELFFAQNVKTAINVAHARGVILSTSLRECGNLFEYTPLQIKQALTGYGRADKNQIQQMVKVFLKLPSIPKPDDAADGLAVALCHSQSSYFANSFRI